MKNKKQKSAPIVIRQAIDDRIFLQNLEVLDQRKGQKIQTLEYYESFKKADVSFVGDTVNAPEKSQINQGDKVLVQMPCGLEIDFEGVKYQVVKRSDIICLL